MSVLIDYENQWLKLPVANTPNHTPFWASYLASGVFVCAAKDCQPLSHSLLKVKLCSSNGDCGRMAIHSFAWRVREGVPGALSLGVNWKRESIKLSVSFTSLAGKGQERKKCYCYIYYSFSLVFGLFNDAI